MNENIFPPSSHNGANNNGISNRVRLAISVERVEFNPDANSVTVYEKQNRSPSCKQANYTILEFIALLAGHISSPYETITFYYGQYSGSYREKEKILVIKKGRKI